MMDQFFQYLVRTGSNIASGQGCLFDMEWTSNRREKNLSFEGKIVIDLANFFNYINSGMADIVKSAGKRADDVGLKFADQKCLIGAEDQSHIDSDLFGCENFECFEAIRGCRKFNNNIFMKFSQRPGLSKHSLGV